jgi:glycolate oxidase FAD binding subunit
VPNQALVLKVASHVGAGSAWPGGEVDTIDGACPKVVAEPSSAEAMASLLRWASQEELTTFVRGGGTKLDWGGVLGSVDLVVSTTGLSSVVAHRHGDLTATVEAGATLAHVNTALSVHRQWLPLDPPWASYATIGGIIATNDSGPRRYRHGAPRDVIIGVTFVRVDGQTAKAGGIVVKNVAGYDLSRLMTGAFGSLGVVVDATFKLAPVAPASRTVLIELGSIEAMAPIVADLVSSALTPSAVELQWPPARILVRFESVESAVESQADEVCRLGAACDSSCRSTVYRDDEEAALWEAHASRWSEPGTLVKVSTLTNAIVPTLVWLREACEERNVDMNAQGRASLGVVDVRMDGAVEAQAQLIRELRERFDVGVGSAVIRRAVSALRLSVDPWGPIGDGLPVMQAIKKRFDPDGRLNPGRGPATLSHPGAGS